MINFKENEALETLNHSCAHMMAHAVKHLWPQAKFWVGPVISEGFYYDIDLGDKSITDEDLAKIEKEITINLGKDTYIQFNKCTFLGNINYIGTSNERCEFNDIIPNNISYFNLTPELEYMKLNSNYEIGIYKLFYNSF